MTKNPTRTQFPAPDTLVVTDAGLETWLVFERGVELPAFAAYPVVATPEGRALLTEYYEHNLAIAPQAGVALVLDAPTWRANPDWAATLGHDRVTLTRFIQESVDLVHRLRAQWRGREPFLVGAAVGPRGDGYAIDVAMNAEEAAAYHSFQLRCLADSPVDVVTAMTIGYADEAIGIARAAEDVDLPIVISFTLETDGRLPSGIPLGDAIACVDDATDRFPIHYMINCAHPTHFEPVLAGAAPWISRIGGLRANASTLSHEELDEMEELDSGDPDDLAERYARLRATLPAMRVVGGCCGTDHRHVAAIVAAILRESV